MGIIYCAINRVNGKIYIGQTSLALEQRKNAHFNNMKGKRDTYFCRALRKYGWNSFSWRVLDSVQDKQELKRLEQEYICMFGSSFPIIGYNSSEGGEGETPNEATREKLRRKNKMYRHTDEAKDRISKSLTGRKRPEETKNKIRQAKIGSNNPQFGKHPSSETRMKLSESRQGAKNPASKLILCIETGEIFGCATEIGTKYGAKTISNISACCLGKRKTSLGYHWTYLKKEITDA